MYGNYEKENIVAKLACAVVVRDYYKIVDDRESSLRYGNSWKSPRERVRTAAAGRIAAWQASNWQFGSRISVSAFLRTYSPGSWPREHSLWWGYCYATCAIRPCRRKYMTTILIVQDSGLLPKSVIAGRIVTLRARTVSPGDIPKVLATYSWVRMMTLG